MSMSVRQQQFVDMFGNVNFELVRAIAEYFGVQSPKSGGSALS